MCRLTYAVSFRRLRTFLSLLRVKAWLSAQAFVHSQNSLFAGKLHFSGRESNISAVVLFPVTRVRAVNKHLAFKPRPGRTVLVEAEKP